MLRVRKGLLLSITALACVIGCDSNNTKKSKKNTDEFAGNAASQNSCNTGQFGNGPQQQNQTQSGFSIQNSDVTYEKDIKPLIQARCLNGCHDGTRQDAKNFSLGGTEPDYNLILENQILIAAVVSGAYPNHPSIVLNQGEIAKFAAWQDNGFPRGDQQNPAINGGITGNPNLPAGSNPCGRAAVPVPANTPATDDPLEALINSELHLTCQAKGVLTNRKAKTCYDNVPIDQSWCTDGGIPAKFDELTQTGAAMRQEMETRSAQGLQVEGCGVEAGTNRPFVTWIGKDLSGEPKVIFWSSIGEHPGD